VTLKEARDHIGAGVIYHPGRADAEDGVITSVNDHYVFVRYGSGGTSAATEPAALTLAADVTIKER
jgi:hypothetical protein